MRVKKNTKRKAAHNARRKRLSKRAPRHIRVGLWLHQHRPKVRFVSLAFVALFIGALFLETMSFLVQSGSYQLSGKAQSLVGSPNQYLAGSLKYEPQAEMYSYNKDYRPGGEVGGQVISPRFSADFSLIPEKGTTVHDPVTKTSVTFKPKFAMKRPEQDQNRLVYPLKTRDAVKVVSLKTIGFKEDIILNKYQGDEISFSYDVALPEGTEARLESNGSLAVYGADYNLLGDISVGSDSDKELLEKARKSAVKRNLLFTFPAPYIKEFGKDTINTNAHFTYDNNVLTVHAQRLDEASYPLTIDPSVYVETAAKLMNGNNESNIDFDIDNELIQKSQTTGARIDEWNSALGLNENRWNGSVAVAGGYIYSVGGVRSNMTSVVYSAEGSDSFVVPTGVTSIVVKMWGGGGGGGAGGSNSSGGNGGGAGFVQSTISVTPSESLNLSIGGGGGGGSTHSSSGDGGGGGGHSGISRGSTALLIAAGGGGGGGGDNSSSTAGGAGGAGGGTSGVNGGSSSSAPGGNGGTSSSGGGGGNGSANDGAAGGAGFGGAGANGGSGNGSGDGSTNNGGVSSGGAGGEGEVGGAGWAGGGGGGSGRFGGGGGSGAISGNAGGGGGGGGSSLTSGGSVTNEAGSGTSPGNSSDSNRSGAGEGGSGGSTNSTGSAGTAGRIIISYSTGVGSTNEARAEVYWAHFNTNNNTIESPNPGDGACTEWCTDSAYDLPGERSALSLVAYNGFLYAIGGEDDSGNRSNNIYIAKIGANGEPSLWHPTSSDKGDWVYWYQSTGTDLSSERSYSTAVAYNNRLYIIGGQTNASPGGVTTVEMADILPNGRLGSWTTTGMKTLPSGAGRHMHSAQVYNDTLYVMGGFEGATTSSANLRNTVHYSKLNSDGTMNDWRSTNSFASARSTFGGVFSSIFGAYMYVGGGCTAVNANGNCTSIASDIELASINADGSIGEWSSMGTIANNRIGYSLVGWQGSLFRVGGCTQQDATTGDCLTTLASADYGVINPAGEVSTVNISSPSGSGFCSGGSPHSCDLPPPGDGAGQGGQMLSMSTILNGYLYVIGGCTNFSCSQSTGNISYVSIGSDGRLQAPDSCSGTSYGAWCVDSSNKVNGNGGISAAGVTTFDNRIYLVGGIDESSTGTTRIYYNSTNTDGSLSGSWSSVSLAGAGISGELAYTFAYARANPSSASTNPGNLYVMGGCSSISASAGCSNQYNTEVYKCNITTSGSVSGCTTSGQLQIDAELATESNQGLGLHSGTVYANYIYLIGGYSDNVGDRDTVFYAKFDNNNNIVDAESGTAILSNNDDDWIETDNTLNTGRRRGWAFGYNGHIYAIGGYDDTGSGQIIPFIEWSKMNVSNGSIDPFETSNVTINQRWGLSVVVSNGYAYVIGGCNVGASPGSCSSFERAVQTFQLYNNDSGAVHNFTAQNDQTFSTATDRIGAASVVHDGYIYVAGGCTNIGCTAVTDNVQRAPISATDGSIGTWADTTDATLPGARAWGGLEVAGGTLYYIGGQTASSSDERPEVFYGTPSGGDVSAWNSVNSSFDLPDGRTQHSTVVWNNRLYVVGGFAQTGGNVSSTVYVSPQLNSGGDITSAWTTSTSFNVARAGAAVTAYANNLYLFGGFDGSNYLSDSQFAKIDGSTGGVGGWTYTTSMPGALRDAHAVAANGYIYIVNGRSEDASCTPKTLITPISANTIIDPENPSSSNLPTGIGEWYETNVKYSGDRYGAAIAYDAGKIYTMGGGCTSIVDGTAGNTRHYYSTVKSQPQIAKYSRMIDTDTDVFPNSWLMNGVDNSIGARWHMRYRSMNDTDGVATDCGTSDMTTWGQETVHGDVTLGTVGVYTPKDGSGNNINCARYFYFFVSIDASKTFGYPEDVNRGPTITDLSLFFVSDPSRRLRHGKTFTGGEQQPLDTPCRREDASPGDPNYHCPLP